MDASGACVRLLCRISIVWFLFSFRFHLEKNPSSLGFHLLQIYFVSIERTRVSSPFFLLAYSKKSYRSISLFYLSRIIFFFPSRLFILLLIYSFVFHRLFLFLALRYFFFLFVSTYVCMSVYIPSGCTMIILILLKKRRRAYFNSFFLSFIIPFFFFILHPNR